MSTPHAKGAGYTLPCVCVPHNCQPRNYDGFKGVSWSQHDSGPAHAVGYLSTPEQASEHKPGEDWVIAPCRSGASKPNRYQTPREVFDVLPALGRKSTQSSDDHEGPFFALLLPWIVLSKPGGARDGFAMDSRCYDGCLTVFALTAIWRPLGATGGPNLPEGPKPKLTLLHTICEEDCEPQCDTLRRTHPIGVSILCIAVLTSNVQDSRQVLFPTDSAI